MKKYVIRTGTGEDFNAAGKARQDADTIAVSTGYEPFVFIGARTANGSPLGAIRLMLDGIRNWNQFIRTAETGSIVLIQYPHYPMKSAYLAKRMIPKAQLKKKLKFIALIHDLDSLRGLHGEGAVYSDTRVLPLFDIIICHNEQMKAYLAKQGIPTPKLISLKLFDYLTDAVPAERKPEDGFVIAGNLSPEKCGYVMEWIRNSGTDRPIHLYGKGLKKEEVPEGITVHGAIAPEKLPGAITGGFGIVWDGPTAKMCGGKAGEYLRYNNSHKLSLYLASGMPVVVWKEAAIADFVRKQEVGITVGNLADAEKAVQKISADEYERMAENAKAIGAKLRSGEFLQSALAEAEKRTRD